MSGNGSRPAAHAAEHDVLRAGKVCLVGAGPGDPELLTIKAEKLIRTAGVILHDALVSSEILALASPSALLLDVGKRCGRKSVTQAEINRLLVKFASQGKLVLRLKSGDPLVFGRAGEELQALREANIAAEVVPGITAAVAAAASVQVSLTDRRYADRVVLVSAHRADHATPTHISALADSRTTLAIYMPGKCGEVAEMLMSTGISPGTACLVISRISLPEESWHFTTLKQLGEVHPLSPSVLLIGNVVNSSVAPRNTCVPSARSKKYDCCPA